MYNNSMLVHASELENFPVLSLQVGGEIARCKKAIINPDELSVAAYTLNVLSMDEDLGGDILSVEDVREFSPNGLIVDSGSRFVSRSDVVRLDKMMSLGFDLIDHKVVSESGKKIGKIKDYTIDTKTFVIYQIIVDRPILKSFIEVVGVTGEIIEKALDNEYFDDLEDCVQYECAKVVGAEYIITRNIKDFKENDVACSNF